MVIALLAAVGLGLWPATARRHGARTRRAARLLSRPRLPAWSRWAMPVVAGALGGVLGSAATGLASALVCATVTGLVRAGWRGRRQRQELQRWSTCLAGLARAVRSGADPLAAVTAARAAAPDVVPLAAVESEMRWAASPAGDVPGEVGTAATGIDDADVLRAGWRLSRRHGVSWAVLLEAQLVDVRSRLAQDEERVSQLAGPRVSGYVLAAMPAAGVLLGTGMGADPVRVLVHTSAGGVLLLVGCALTCAGLAWTARIVRG